MSNSRQRKQDEKNQRVLREVAALPENKHCADCHQRGPTYVNMTAGSFVCTGCSGILRGLNPPQRVKSISMATFTTDEIEFIKQHGNNKCRQIWLGLFDGNEPKVDGARDDHQIKDFLVLKYERRRWYVSPDEIARQTKLMQQAATNASHAQPQTQSVPATAAPASSGASLLDAFGSDTQTVNSGSSAVNTSVSRPHANTQLPSKLPGAPYKPPSTSSAPPPVSAAPKSTLDLLSDDPFAPVPTDFTASTSSSAAVAPPAFPVSQATTPAPPMSANTTASSTGAFADFANFDSFTTANNQSADMSTDFAAFNGGHQQHQPQQQPAVAKPITPSASHFGMAPLMPTSTSAALPKSATMPATVTTTSSSSVPPTANGGDKYSALAELDELFSGADATAPAGNGGGGATTTTVSSASWGQTTSSQPKQVAGAPINWGGFGAGGTPSSQSHSNSVFGSPTSSGSATSTTGPPAGAVFSQPMTNGVGHHHQQPNPFFNGTGGGPQQQGVRPQMQQQQHHQQYQQQQPAQQQQQQQQWGQQPQANPFGLNATPHQQQQANPFGMPGTLHSGTTPTPMQQPQWGHPAQQQQQQQQQWAQFNNNRAPVASAAPQQPVQFGMQPNMMMTPGGQPAQKWNPFLS